MKNIVSLNTQLAQNANADPRDVLTMKSSLAHLGFYEPPEWGVSQYPDQALFDAIRTFQDTNGLKQDGVMKPGGESEATLQTIQSQALSLQSLGRNGDTILAHITPAEARLLHRETDGGSINPVTGLFEFWGGWDRDDNGNAYDNDAQHGDTDASAAEASDSQAAENDRQGMNDHDGGGNNGTDNNTLGVGPSGNGSQDLNAQSTKTTVVEDDEKQAKQANRRNHTVTTPDDDPSLTSNFLDKKADEEEDNPSGYNPDETIDDVERQTKEIYAASAKAVADEKKTKPRVIGKKMWQPKPGIL